MKKKFGKSKNVFLIPNALSVSAGLKSLNIYEKSTDNSFNQKSDEIPKNKISVETITLDTYLMSKNINKVDILKIDTQSFNHQILEGSKISLKKKLFEIIEIEINLGDYYDYSNNFLEIEKYLSNYKLAGINKSGSIIDNKKFYVDVYYIKKSN